MKTQSAGIFAFGFRRDQESDVLSGWGRQGWGGVGVGVRLALSSVASALSPSGSGVRRR